jgi:polyketide synthase PksN
LIGSLAKEYASWKVRMIDVDGPEDWPCARLLRVPPDERGDVWCHRDGEWYRQALLPCESPEAGGATYRQGGVYVLIGGAGGLGEVFTEHLIRRYGAHVIWLGRRAEDDGIKEKRQRLGRLGPTPEYVQADATDRQMLEQAYGEIKQRHGSIHGVVHAAIVLLDRSLLAMDEARFKSSLAAKVDSCVRVAQVFGREKLDLVLFFSSLQSMAKAPGQSNYAAGCTFEDAFAHELRLVWSCDVKVMNWGYWGTIGVVASEAYRQRMAQAGVGSIDAGEGMRALDALVGGPFDQLAFSKGIGPLSRESGESVVSFYATESPSVVASLELV